MIYVEILAWIDGPVMAGCTSIVTQYADEETVIRDCYRMVEEPNRTYVEARRIHRYDDTRTFFTIYHNFCSF